MRLWENFPLERFHSYTKYVQGINPKNISLLCFVELRISWFSIRSSEIAKVFPFTLCHLVSSLCISRHSCMWLDIPGYVGEGGNTDSCQNGCGGGRLDAGAYTASIWQAFRLASSLVVSNILTNEVLKNNRSNTLTRIHQGIEFHNVCSDLHG